VDKAPVLIKKDAELFLAWFEREHSTRESGTRASD
jgi:hypothetical protein